ncbi:Forkhead-associated [Cordyceps militaris CM01]|uniref:Forkhead-associated n=1 Tax=Cordyceps militaris (strain CM01) TaxID=983644 RepID=G3JSD6_CORMM|nr:Forkhead-associated [Cordyceps militaris CM01]EGX88728.1 Forkhead-associated [Cordyceps militaris CM01]
MPFDSDKLAGSLANEPRLPMPSATSTSLAGTKRPAPSLLPPFELLSSSPGLPRTSKRQNTATDASLRYPTPIPTSSTGILSSSPLRRNSAAIGEARNAMVEKRAPLGALPSVELAENGEPLLMGRSSNSAHYQLSASRLISRVHVKARFVAATEPEEANKVEIVCEGWNGLKLHCQGRSWDLSKGDTFSSETEAEIMIDVQEARVLLQWPRLSSAIDNVGNLSDSSWDDSPPRSQTRPGRLFDSSPLRRHAASIRSPESPTPVHLASSQRLHDLLPSPSELDGAIEIYEDEPELPGQITLDPNASMLTEATASFHSHLDDEEDDEAEHNPDEENDPIVHSFGPFGADISNRLASILGKSPRAGNPLGRDIPELAENPEASETHTESSLLSDPPSPETRDEETPTPDDQLLSEEEEDREPTPQKPKVTVHPGVANHVVNQLAYSRLSSTPLSVIMQHLPDDFKVDLTRDALCEVIESTGCLGIIPRQGKDAAGKVLESEYYYLPEKDNDSERRAAVVDDLRKPSLRNCRKQHKQYYWKRPRTP